MVRSSRRDSEWIDSKASITQLKRMEESRMLVMSADSVRDLRLVREPRVSR